jgi:hypothetical protein
MPDDKILALYEKGSYDVVPHDGMRKIIAQRLTLSKQTIPHFYLTVECRIDNLLRAREQVNASAPKEGPRAFKLSVNDFVIKALGLALAQVPAANVTWTEAGTLRHKYSDVGVAVAVEGACSRPSSGTQSSSRCRDLQRDEDLASAREEAGAARVSGRHHSISNLGMYGIKSFEAVINPARHHPGHRCRREARGRGGRQNRGRHLDVVHAVRGPSGGGRCRRRRASQCPQDAGRGARAHAGVTAKPASDLQGNSVWRACNRRASSTDSGPSTARPV